MKKVLFLCTGNYYRSRFAELLFNHLAAQAGLNWRADSRGVATELGIYNFGPISATTVEVLRARGVAVDVKQRYPLQLQESELAGADLVIALDEQEHRPFMQSRFPAWAGRITYWHIQDLGLAPATVALPQIETEVTRLVTRLRSQAQRAMQPAASRAGYRVARSPKR
jgi:protein-tyrosine phosphatase